MAYQKITIEITSAGVLNTPFVLNTNLETNAWVLSTNRLNPLEAKIGTDAQTQAAYLFQAINDDCAIGDYFGDCLVLYDGDKTFSITFYDTNITSVTYTTPIQNGLGAIITTESVDEGWSKISQDILVRSPYWQGLGDESSPLGNINGCNSDLYIYKGTFLEDRPSTPTFQLNTLSTNINETIYFDLSDMIRDYLEPVYSEDGTPICEAVWVDIFSTVNYNGFDYPQQPRFHRAFLGYGYFEDGTNPLLIDYSPDAASEDYKEILNESPEIIIPTGEQVEVVVDSNLVDTVVYYDSSDVVIKTDNISGSDESSEQIIYSTSPDSLTTAKVIVTNNDASTEERLVKYIDECLFTPYRITFINRNGVYERLWFFKNSQKKAKYESKDFRRNTFSAGNYRTVDHQQKKLYKKSKETIKINSGWYSESFNDVFNQLMLSESVWINYNSKELPVNISDSSFTYKTKFDEKLINHTLELEFAFDKINSVR